MLRERTGQPSGTAKRRKTKCGGTGVEKSADSTDEVGEHRAGSERQWRASLTSYAFPCIGDKPVDAVTTADIMVVLLPIWSTKRVIATRVRQRIGTVMKWAVAQGLRADNLAGDAIAAALPKNAPAQRHQRALPHAEVGAALRRVRRCDAYRGIRLAFEFLVLTASRSGEARNARWQDIDRVDDARMREPHGGVLQHLRQPRGLRERPTCFGDSMPYSKRKPWISLAWAERLPPVVCAPARLHRNHAPRAVAPF